MPIFNSSHHHITIVLVVHGPGYVCEKEELSGIFVKSVTPGSAAALSGMVRVNDRIVAVDGVSLAGKSNQRAVDALKQSRNVVTLELERLLLT